ncbi:MAG: FkbM family methyltransferase, partial [Actinomycetota bacterium]
LAHLDLIDPNSTEVLAFIRRHGLAAYEPPTAAAVMALCELAGTGFVAFDVGSNVGLYSHLAAAVFDPSKVVAFEPAPFTAKVSRRIAAKNELAVDVVEAAVGDEEGTATLHFSPHADSTNSLVEGFRASVDSTVVRLVTVDAHVERTGVVPDVVKIDVETYEQQVLRGARRTLETHRPAVIIEVLKRKGHDHGVELTEEMAGLGYQYYALPAAPTWEASPAIHGLGTTDRDWLLLPDPITPAFTDAWTRWSARLAEITVDRNPRVPILATVKGALGRGGPLEVGRAARRYVVARRRERSGR